MRRFILCFLFLFILSSGMIFVWIRQNKTDDILNEYQQKLPFSNREMSYRSITRSLTHNGLVFYQPSFPVLPLVVQVERMNLKNDKNETVIRLSGITLDVAQTLMKRDGLALSQTLSRFEAPYDFLLKPLETLAILNQDIVKGDAEIKIRKVGNEQKLELSLETKGRLVLKVDTTLTDSAGKGLWRFLEGTFQKIHVEVSDRQLLNAIAGYYTAINEPVPPLLKRVLNAGSSFQADAELNQPWPISKLLERF